MTDAEKECLETLRHLTLQVMLIAAGVFGIVGGFVSSSTKMFDSKWSLIAALLCFAVSWFAGYVTHGSIIGLLNRGRFDPHNKLVQGSSLVQVLLFSSGGVLFVWFVGNNL